MPSQDGDRTQPELRETGQVTKLRTWRTRAALAAGLGVPLGLVAANDPAAADTLVDNNFGGADDSATVNDHEPTNQDFDASNFEDDIDVENYDYFAEGDFSDGGFYDDVIADAGSNNETTTSESNLEIGLGSDPDSITETIESVSDDVPLAADPHSYDEVGIHVAAQSTNEEQDLLEALLSEGNGSDLWSDDLEIADLEGKFVEIPAAGHETLGDYSIQKGDYLGRIAENNNVSADAIRRANPDISDWQHIQPGQKVSIPFEGSRTYRVHENGTLGGIVARTGVSEAAIRGANPDISDWKNIQRGQVVQIPSQTPSDAGVERTEPAIPFGVAEEPQTRQNPTSRPDPYKVKPGDTVSELAEEFGVTQQELMKANGISDPSKLQRGTTLTIPERSNIPMPSTKPDGQLVRPEDRESPPEAYPTDGEPLIYSAEAGDSIADVAHLHWVTTEELMAVNDIDNPENLRTGQRITIPPPTAESPGSASHRVLPDETLLGVATRFGVKQESIAELNGLDEASSITAGSYLKIPAITDENRWRNPFVNPEPRPIVNTPVEDYEELPLRVRWDWGDRQELIPEFEKWSATYDVPPDLLMAVAWRESKWREDDLSKKGAQGIGQLLPATSEFVATDLIKDPDLDPTKAPENIQMSARYLRYVLDISDDDVDDALRKYYQGQGSIAKSGSLDDTENYVRGVKKNMAMFKSKPAATK